MTKLVNRAKMTTATTGTGTITLGTAEAGYQSFADAGVVDGDVVRYVIEDGTAFEIGTGTFTASGTTLTRTVSESSNADAALNLTGSAVVYVSATAADIPPVLELYAENPSSPTAPSATGTNAVAIGTQSVSSGFAATAIGRNAQAQTERSLSLGDFSTASGERATAISSDAVASGQYSAAIGNNSGSSGSRAAGVGAMALGGSFASGTDSFAAAIANNTSSFGATGANSVAIGRQARATNQHAIALGLSSQATDDFAVALGNNAKAAGFGSISISAGSASRFAEALQSFSVAIGYRSKSDTRGKFAFSNDAFSLTGDSQTGTFVLRSDTTDATPEALTSSNSAASTTNQINLPNNSAYAFHGTIVARQQASQGTACAAFKIEGLIRREGNAASTVLVNSATTVLDNTPGFGMTLSADTVNGGLKIEVTGLAATNIRFVATVHTSECTF